MSETDQLALFPETDAVSLPQRDWGLITPTPLGDAVDAEPARTTAPDATAPTLFDLDPR